MKNLQINYLAVLLAAFITFILGAAYYISVSSTWQAYTGVTDETASAAGFGAYGISFVTYILGAFAMAVVFKSMGVSTFKTGAIMGALIGALIVGGNIFTNNAYELKPIGLSLLNAFFSTLSGAVQGAILGVWTKKES